MEIISPILRKRITNTGLTLTKLNDRYWKVKKRCLLRGVKPPKRVNFYFEFIKQFENLQKLEEYQGLEATQLFNLLDVHSTEPNRDYNTFELCTRKKHHEIHKKQRQMKWDEVKRVGEKVCTQCQKIKSLNSFYRNKQHPSGHRPDCKECHKARVEINKKLREVA